MCVKDTLTERSKGFESGLSCASTGTTPFRHYSGFRVDGTTPKRWFI